MNGSHWFTLTSYPPILRYLLLHCEYSLLNLSSISKLYRKLFTFLSFRVNTNLKDRESLSCWGFGIFDLIRSNNKVKALWRVAFSSSSLRFLQWSSRAVNLPKLAAQQLRSSALWWKSSQWTGEWDEVSFLVPEGSLMTPSWMKSVSQLQTL